MYRKSLIDLLLIREWLVEKSKIKAKFARFLHLSWLQKVSLLISFKDIFNQLMNFLTNLIFFDFSSQNHNFLSSSILSIFFQLFLSSLPLTFFHNFFSASVSTALIFFLSSSFPSRDFFVWKYSVSLEFNYCYFLSLVNFLSLPDLLKEFISPLNSNYYVKKYSDTYFTDREKNELLSWRIGPLLTSPLRTCRMSEKFYKRE